MNPRMFDLESVMTTRLCAGGSQRRLGSDLGHTSRVDAGIGVERDDRSPVGPCGSSECRTSVDSRHRR